jgi:cyanophycin synthetase
MNGWNLVGLEVVSQNIIEWAGAPQFFSGCVPGWGRPCLLIPLSLHLSQNRSLDFVQLDEKIQALVQGVVLEFSSQDQTATSQLLGRLQAWTAALLHSAGLPISRAEDRIKAIKMKLGVEGLVLVCPLQNQRDVLAVFRWLVSAVNHALAGESLATVADQLPALLKSLRGGAPQGMNTLRFLEAADQAGIPWQRVWGNVFQFGWGARARRLDSSFTDATPTISARLARNKLATSALLRQAGIPVPDHGLAQSADAAEKLANQLGYPVVVKPADLDGGRGVAAGLKTAQAVRKAFVAAARLSSAVLVEKHFEGKDYRLQVFQNEVFWVVERVPGGVTGDGLRSVADLLAELNADPRRGEPGSAALRKRIPLDEEALALLGEQGLSAQAIPQANVFVRLRRAANVASGGLPVPALEKAHPDNLALAVRAARLLRLDLAGVDLLIPDISRSWLESGAAICEVNAQPQMSPHLPAYVLSRLVQGQGRVPVVVVLGLASEPGFGHRICDALSSTGLRVGMATPEAVTIEGHVVMKSPSYVYAGGLALIADPSVDVMVLCVDDESILKTGLPVDRFDVLLLAGPPKAAASAPTWQRWRGFARFLLKACTGPVMVNTDCEQWSTFLPHLTAWDVRSMPLAQMPASLSRELLEN